MSMHKVMVTQVLRITRKTVILVEADSSRDLDHKLDEGDYDLPESGSTQWETVVSSVQDEEVMPL